MIYGVLLFCFVLLCFFMIFLVLIQKGKGGLGVAYGGQEMLFGGSGGQDFFQKLTWVLGFFLMAGSLSLSLMKTNYFRQARYISLDQVPKKSADTSKASPQDIEKAKLNNNKSSEKNPATTKKSEPEKKPSNSAKPVEAGKKKT